MVVTKTSLPKDGSTKNHAILFPFKIKIKKIDGMIPKMHDNTLANLFFNANEGATAIFFFFCGWEMSIVINNFISNAMNYV